VHVSAQTGAGIAELCSLLATWLVPHAPPPGAAVPFTEGLAEQIEESERLLRSGDVAGATRALATVQDQQEL
jgi:hypothetical protein